jgi:hypothetical protein
MLVSWRRRVAALCTSIAGVTGVASMAGGFTLPGSSRSSEFSPVSLSASHVNGKWVLCIPSKAKRAWAGLCKLGGSCLVDVDGNPFPVGSSLASVFGVIIGAALVGGLAALVRIELPICVGVDHISVSLRVGWSLGKDPWTP